MELVCSMVEIVGCGNSVKETKGVVLICWGMGFQRLMTRGCPFQSYCREFHYSSGAEAPMKRIEAPCKMLHSLYSVFLILLEIQQCFEQLAAVMW